MSHVPSGTELARPFIPTRDFDLSKRFYGALGFEKVLDGEVAIFNARSGGFILQRHYNKATTTRPLQQGHYNKDWAENCMMQLMVDDLDAWWTHIEDLDLPSTFNVQPPLAPAMQTWGLRVAYLFDPCGVQWHICQRRAGAKQD